MIINLFGYEISIQKPYFNGFHYTDYVCDTEYDRETKPYQHDFSIDHRLQALAGHHGTIEWAFRSFSEAIVAYGIDAIEVLNGVIERLLKIRTTLEDKGATDEQLNIYDSKIHACFDLVLQSIKNRIDSDNNQYMQQDIELLNSIKDYDIHSYHK